MNGVLCVFCPTTIITKTSESATLEKGSLDHYLEVSTVVESFLRSFHKNFDESVDFGNFLLHKNRSQPRFTHNINNHSTNINTLDHLLEKLCSFKEIPAKKLQDT